MAADQQRFLFTMTVIGSDITGRTGIGQPLSATASAVHS
jgi:hypothetical protein